MEINLSVQELWFWRVSIILLWVLLIYTSIHPYTIETTEIYYATFTPESELKIEEPQIYKSMGCNIYWRAKGYPCYDIN